MDTLLIIFLTLLNGAFAMSEMSLAASRKARLAAMAEVGDKGAQTALHLLEHPTQFLSSVQVGITSIAILSGIVGEAAFSDDLSVWLQGMGMPPRPSAIAATAIVVAIITFITILFGELVPWLALNRRGLTVFIHPQTGNARADHSDHVLWLGASRKLKLDALR